MCVCFRQISSCEHSCLLPPVTHVPSIAFTYFVGEKISAYHTLKIEFNLIWNKLCSFLPLYSPPPSPQHIPGFKGVSHLTEHVQTWLGSAEQCFLPPAPSLLICARCISGRQLCSCGQALPTLKDSAGPAQIFFDLSVGELMSLLPGFLQKHKSPCEAQMQSGTVTPVWHFIGQGSQKPQFGSRGKKAAFHFHIIPWAFYQRSAPRSERRLWNMPRLISPHSGMQQEHIKMCHFGLFFDHTACMLLGSTLSVLTSFWWKKSIFGA